MPKRRAGVQPGDRPVVLYIEDNLANQRLMHAIISRRFAVDLIVADTAEGGLTAVLQLHPVLVMLDLGLPDADGAAVLLAIRSTDETSDIPVWVVTGDSSDQRRLELLDSGADGYIVKPFELDALTATFDQLGLPRS